VTVSYTGVFVTDLIVVGGDRLNMLPLSEPAAAMVVQANAANVRDVLVAGRAVKRDGQLVGVDTRRLRRLIDDSRERVFARVLADGPILPEPPAGMLEAMDTLSRTNLAAAWAQS